jgi:histone H3/H4
VYSRRRGIKPDENGHFENNRRVNLSMANTIVKAAVKEELSEMNVAGDFYDALDAEVQDLLADAAQRAQDNDRKTVSPRDL